MKSRTSDELPPVTVYTDVEARHEAQLQRQGEEFAEQSSRADELTEALELYDDGDDRDDRNPRDYA